MVNLIIGLLFGAVAAAAIGIMWRMAVNLRHAIEEDDESLEPRSTGHGGHIFERMSDDG
jgi:hypothetical protein